jgi:hypothetical protein
MNGVCDGCVTVDEPAAAPPRLDWAAAGFLRRGRDACPQATRRRASKLTVLSGIGIGVVEGVEGALVRNGDLEAVARALVGDRDGHRVVAGVPAQDDAEAVPLPGRQLLALPLGAHDDSFRVRVDTAMLDPARNALVTGP